MIKCTLIEVDNDNRAIICVGDDPHGKVERTAPIILINHAVRTFCTETKWYEFNTADEAVK
jgi:hypothetical protein